MSTAVLVPYRADPGRAAAWTWLRRRYAMLHPDWPLVVADCSTPEWRKGLAVAEGLARIDAEIVVVADADCVLDAAALLAAARLAQSAPWVMPHRRVYRMSAGTTRVTLGRNPWVMPRYASAQHPAPRGGGVVVARREVLEAVPLDPRFEGWGGEDISWGWALDTIAGPHVCLGAALWHLWHAPQPTRRKALPATNALAGRYRDACGDRDAMAALIAEFR